MAIADDLKEAFAQIRVRREDRDALRFHWLKDLASKQVKTLRFTRVLFGLAPSPFLLAAVIKQYLQRYKMVNPELVVTSSGFTIACSPFHVHTALYL